MRKRQAQDDEGGGANWMDTYGDLVTLLLCFFVLLYSFSSVDAVKWEALVKSLANMSGNSVLSQYKSETPIITEPGPGIVNPTPTGWPLEAVVTLQSTAEPTTMVTTVATPIETAAATEAEPTAAAPTATPAPTKKPTPSPVPGNVAAMRKMTTQINNYLASSSIASGTIIVKADSTLRIRLIASIIFEPGKAVLKSNAVQVLNDLTSIINSYSASITSLHTEGHTDSVTTPEGDISKFNLAGDRAAIVLDTILGGCKLGSNVDKYFSSFGCEQLIESDNTAEGRDKNNRVDIVISTKLDA